MSIFCCKKERTYAVRGEQGGINTVITLPEGFNPETDKCPMVVLMHGFMASLKGHPGASLAKVLAREGFASIRFDFNAHGKSEGKFIDMTIANEIADGKAVMDYVSGLPYVTKVGVVGHSQGGVIAGMMAGELENDKRRPACIALLAPAAVLKDDAIKGTCMGIKYNAANPPEYVNVWFHKLGRKFILAAQKLPLFETSSLYTGPVCIVHGKKDKIVPYTYAERYHAGYKQSQLHLLENEGHFMKKKFPEIAEIVTAFLKEHLYLFSQPQQAFA